MGGRRARASRALRDPASQGLNGNQNLTCSWKGKEHPKERALRVWLCQWFTFVVAFMFIRSSAVNFSLLLRNWRMHFIRELKCPTKVLSYLHAPKNTPCLITKAQNPSPKLQSCSFHRERWGPAQSLWDEHFKSTSSPGRRRPPTICSWEGHEWSGASGYAIYLRHSQLLAPALSQLLSLLYTQLWRRQKWQPLLHSGETKTQRSGWLAQAHTKSHF